MKTHLSSVTAPFRFGNGEGSIDVSSKGAAAYRCLSPFAHSPDYAIPIPGNERVCADSVEGIWQGLKLVDGVMDATLFKGQPHKRKGDVFGHQYGDEQLPYIEARKHIFVPAYIYHAINNALPEVADDLERKLAAGPISFHDVEANGNIDNPAAAYSHAALLTDLLNTLHESPLPPFSKQPFTYLQEQVDGTIACRDTLGDKRRLLDTVVTFAYLFSHDDLKQAFALHAIAQGLPDEGRHKRVTLLPKNQELYARLF